MAFQFRLERVLAWKRSLCELEEYRTRQLIAAVKQTEVELATLETSRDEVSRKLVASPQVDGASLEALDAWREATLRKQLELARNRQQLQARLAEQRTRWMEAQRGCRLIEKLRERRAREYTYQEERSIESLAEESYLAQWGNRG